MLDWQKAVLDIGNVSEVHIVSVANECKELLLVVDREVQNLKVFCVNDGQVFSYTSNDEIRNFYQQPSNPRYLYEPNASVMKAGCFQLIAQRFGISQPDKNSHLFLSEQIIPDFPGRGFVIERT